MAKILIITWNFPPTIGGIENLIGDIYSNLSQYHQVKVITTGAQRDEKDENIVRIKTKNVGIFMIKAFITAIRMHLNQSYNLLLAGSLLISPITIIIGILSRTPRISMSYGLDIIYPNFLYQKLIASTINRNQAVIVISEHSKNLLIQRGLSKRKVEVIYPGVSEKFIKGQKKIPEPQLLRREFGIDKLPCLVSVGRLTKRKGILRFVRECLPRILKEFPDCILIIVGDDPKQALVHREGELDKIKQAVKELSLEESVLFKGQVDDSELMKIYNAADIFIFPVIDLPNDVEGFGMVAIEAAVFGKPSVASRIGGIPDAVEDKVSGFLVPPGDTVTFADAITELIRNEELREKMGSDAQDRVMRQFTWPVLVQNWNALIENILSPQSRTEAVSTEIQQPL